MMAPPDNDVLPCLQNGCTPFLEGKFVSLVEQKSGIVFDNIKRKEIKKNITVCMEELGEKSFIKYYERLISTEGDGEELKKLINFITINETFFLRVQEHFDILKNVAAPELMHRKKEKSIKVWSAGASSGEEVYSIIITLLSVPGLKEHFDLDVLGTDINDDMLYIARQGVYRGRTLDKVPPKILNYYFEPFRKDRFKVTEEVKKHARFEYLNLVQPLNLDFFGNPDIIFFRNVLIYFNEETTRRLINAFYDMLSDGGYLFLGPSETLWEMS
ncbi:MAG: protein-glutamate O-methyltransferase CheR, partial [bacterium]|nr:protein-glutamate O-methyltransferase CheR [bacterium]